MVQSALRVQEAIEIPGRNDDPGHLYVSVADDWTGSIPAEQVRARDRLEQFATVLRIVFMKDDYDLFKGFFRRLLASAQATFSATGFQSAALNDLANFEKEIVQAAGPQIKARYSLRLLKSVTLATVLILLLSFGLESIANFGTAAPLLSDRTTEMSAANPSLPVTALSSSKSIGTYLRWPDDFSFMHTGVLLAASMWGLFFASLTRNIDPTFETLVTPDADLITPWVRLTFFGTAILAIALIFQLRIVAVSFGDRLSTAQISENLVAAILVGLLLGVSERALPKEVEHWSKKLMPSNSNPTT